MEVLVRLSGLLALLIAGTGLRRVSVLDAGRTELLNQVAYYVALPALVFVATYDQAIGEIVSWELFVAVLAAFLGTVIAASLVHRNRSPSGRRSVAVVQSYHSNLGYLGVPLVAATFDAEVTAIASVVLGIGSLVQVPLTVVLLVSMNGANAEGALGRHLRSLASNPVLIALVAGMAIGWFELGVPTAAATALDWVGSLALPLALLCVGATLQVDPATIDRGATASVVGLKVACMPAIAWGALALLGVNAATLTAGVVMLGTPTAVSTYVFATELGGDATFASLNVFVTTVASVASLTLLIELVGIAV
ncbi:AEC family transporter [Halorubrum kocurii]|uniref:Auxin efflux carrier family protein n=1 Tax=Halorubrum kocurii JCM 14978 TaxID=1230456 RepID=M0P6B1_9EURY|nr:AEC family transporter [Halorubrum kocurii]EMA65591.1 auxin efflux carrier family protein [Halorubrum kocurii JCM 14978]